MVAHLVQVGHCLPRGRVSCQVSEEVAYIALWVNRVKPAGMSITWRHLLGALSGGVWSGRDGCDGAIRAVLSPLIHGHPWSWYPHWSGLLHDGLRLSRRKSLLILASGDVAEMVVFQMTCSHGCVRLPLMNPCLNVL